MREKGKTGELSPNFIYRKKKTSPSNSVYQWLMYPYKPSEIPYNPNISDYNKGRKEKNQNL